MYFGLLIIDEPTNAKLNNLGSLKRRDGCGNREEVAPTIPDDDYDLADDDTLSAEETMRIFEALGPDVEITGPPSNTIIPGAFRSTAGLTSAYVATTKTYVLPGVTVPYDPAVRPTG